eukprot:CAMPEP_0205943316 /NCGR_PEP_ID=MMETSP1325-20131115/60092_1 /ASSEMBLY_ACC=CAM_ASM_000708 /TAXON_ID=236786 /ORGANISM="Florenciella sp., Strain RCC1007" /LENGTH=55 /DNA_ID=CAMNT_0053314111 /DNA_START=1 /DNA_END=164 /DNA_ORIENTATION=-
MLSVVEALAKRAAIVPILHTPLDQADRKEEQSEARGSVVGSKRKASDAAAEGHQA